MNRVIDSSALLAYFRDETGAQEVADILRDPRQNNLVHASNLCEVYYDLLRFFGEQIAETALAAVYSFGLVLRTDLDVAFWKEAGKHKATLSHISLADCYCLALAQRVEAEIITCDHEFDQVVERGLCRVRFVR